jgi:hypothetical protein
MRRRRKSKLEPEYHYEIKYLINSGAIGKPGMTIIAIPDKFEGKPVRVYHEGKQMVIPRCGKDYLAYREFEDKFGRDKHYRLIYYQWKPMTEEEVEMENVKKFLI